MQNATTETTPAFAVTVTADESLTSRVCFADSVNVAALSSPARPRAAEIAAADDAAFAALTEGVGVDAQGPTVAFVLRDAAGRVVGHSVAERVAAVAGVAIRGGCFCNPGACAALLGHTAADVRRFHAAGRSCGGDDHAVVDGRPTGALRASLGHATTAADVAAFTDFLSRHFLLPAAASSAAAPASAPLASAPPPPAAMAVRVTGLAVFPVKGVAGVPVRRWPLGRDGLLLDREWMIVSAATAAVVAPKHCRALIRLRAALRPAANALVLWCDDGPRGDAAGDAAAGGRFLALGLRPAAAGGGAAPLLGAVAAEAAADGAPPDPPATALLFPTAPAGGGGGGADAAAATSIRGRVVGSFDRYATTGATAPADGAAASAWAADADRWLSARLGVAVHLARRPGWDAPAAAPSARPPRGDGDDPPPPGARGGDVATFANTGALLVVSEASHARVLAALPSDEERGRTGIDAYRANVVVAHAAGNGSPEAVPAAMLENHWRRLRLPLVVAGTDLGGAAPAAAVSLRAVGACVRCEQVGVRHGEGAISAAPLAAIARVTAAAEGAKPKGPAGRAVLGELFSIDVTTPDEPPKQPPSIRRDAADASPAASMDATMSTLRPLAPALLGWAAATAACGVLWSLPRVRRGAVACPLPASPSALPKNVAAGPALRWETVATVSVGTMLAAEFVE